MNRFITLMLTLAAVARCALAGTSDTAFTYQGELKDGDKLVNSPVDMEFSIWDAPFGGNQVGGVEEFVDVPVDFGRFVVELDFGVAPFSDSPRWLNIVINGTPLAPRQPITRVPYCIQTRGIFVDAANSVGIGTTVPEAQLGIDGTLSPLIGLLVRQPGSATGAVMISSPGGVPGIIGLANNGHRRDIRFSDVGMELLASSSSAPPNPANVIALTESGEVGIGTQVPNVRLHVIDEGSAILAEATSVEGAIAVHGLTNAPLGTGVKGECGISGIGVWGLGTNTFGVSYAVGGQSDSPNGFDFYAAGAGTDYGSTSSIRWKRNIEPIADPLRMLNEMRGVYFDWDETHDGQHAIGMIAEEVGKVLPEIVVYESNGIDAIGMDYSKLTPLLVEAVKALRAEKDAEMETLQAENDALRERVAALENMFAQLVVKQTEGSQ